jgi:hypothetical protein
MSEEHLRMLEALGTLAREEQEELSELEALCDPVERAGALQQARNVPGLAQATQPLSAESQALIVQRVQEALRSRSPLQPHAALPGGSPANENAVLARAAVVGEPVVKRKRPSARAQPRPVPQKVAPKPLRTWVSVALPLLAAAAAVLLWLDPAVPETGELPEYSLTARASSSFRGELEAIQDGPVTVTQGGTLELELRPETEYEGQLELHVQVQRGGTSSEVPARIEQSPHGALRVHVDRANLPGKGTARLQVTVARPEALPPPAARDSSAQLHGEGWQAWLVEVALP